MINSFGKRIYTARSFSSDMRDAIQHIPQMRETMRSRRVSRAFTEKIMLVISQVNGCRYCSYFHTRMALTSGVDEVEIEKLMALETGEFPPEQAVALAFAQHYAESGCCPDPEAEARFRKYYGPQVSGDIMNVIRMIKMGNLAGNTVDAFLSRLKGAPAPGSSAVWEALFFWLSLPVTVPMLIKMRNMESNQEHKNHEEFSW
jgi:AhpD family alkylhydroperoxidase